MQLTRHTDYGLRILIYLALLPKHQRTNVDEISKIYGISRNNLNKIVHQLGQTPFIDTKRGKGGGFLLALPPEQVNLGEIVELLENTLDVVDCEAQRCTLLPRCRLKGILNEATKAFIDTLKKRSLADLINKPTSELVEVLKLSE